MSAPPLPPPDPSPGASSDAPQPAGIQAGRPDPVRPDVPCPRCGKSVPWLCLLCPHCEEPPPRAAPDFGVQLAQLGRGAAYQCFAAVVVFAVLMVGVALLLAVLGGRPGRVVAAATLIVLPAVLAFSAVLATGWRRRWLSAESRLFLMDFLASACAVALVGLALLLLVVVAVRAVVAAL